jgi:MFS family permease
MTMTAVTPQTDLDAKRQDTKRVERRAAGVAFGAHALHDGYTDLIYVMLPVWQAEFGLGYAALGVLRGLFSGTMAGLQIPASFIAERWGAPAVLALGTLLTGGAYMLAGWSGGLIMLAVALFLGGAGSSTQHPLASELIAQAFSGPRSRKALGTYNFAGDIGKMAVPLAASLLLVVLPWREALAILGGCGIVAAVAIFALMPRYAPAQATPKSANGGPLRAPRRLAFPVLTTVGVLDSATRMAFLTFLPFVLTAKGASLPTVGVALTLVFAGGAVGKLACAFLGARIGTIATVWVTEIVTALGIAALLPLPLEGVLVLLPIVGIALNGTSSVLYGSVPDLVPPEKRVRAFGIFYTGTIGAGAISPAVFGALGDLMSVTVSMLCIAALALLTLPLITWLRQDLADRP